MTASPRGRAPGQWEARLDESAQCYSIQLLYYSRVYEMFVYLGLYAILKNLKWIHMLFFTEMNELIILF